MNNDNSTPNGPSHTAISDSYLTIRRLLVETHEWLDENHNQSLFNKSHLYWADCRERILSDIELALREDARKYADSHRTYIDIFLTNYAHELRQELLEKYENILKDNEDTAWHTLTAPASVGIASAINLFDFSSAESKTLFNNLLASFADLAFVIADRIFHKRKYYKSWSQQFENATSRLSAEDRFKTERIIYYDTDKALARLPEYQFKIIKLMREYRDISHVANHLHLSEQTTLRYLAVALTELAKVITPEQLAQRIQQLAKDANYRDKVYNDLVADELLQLEAAERFAAEHRTLT